MTNSILQSKKVQAALLSSKVIDEKPISCKPQDFYNFSPSALLQTFLKVKK